MADFQDSTHFKTARFIATKFLIARYLMSNAEGRWNGAEKADRHDELCRYYACLLLDHRDPDTVRRRRGDIGEVMWQAIHKETQELTGYLDERIGFPLEGRPDYDSLIPLFFEQFDALAITAATRVLAMTQIAPRKDDGCETCRGNGMIGGPSYYAPDEGGVPCPDCSPQEGGAR